MTRHSKSVNQLEFNQDNVIALLHHCGLGYDWATEIWKRLDNNGVGCFDHVSVIFYHAEHLDLKRAIFQGILNLGHQLELAKLLPQPSFKPVITHDRKYILAVIEDHIDSNIQNSKSMMRQDHHFLYIVNGRGMGKTMTGFRTSNFMLESPKYQQFTRYSIYIDLSNEFRYDENMDKNISIEMSLGVRIASCITGVNWKSLCLKFKDRMEQLTFSVVMKRLATLRSQQQQNPLPPCLISIHLDEIQVNTKFTREILNLIGCFMCSSSSTMTSSSNQQSMSDGQILNIIIIPILTGTSSKGLRPQANDSYGLKSITLLPFTTKESWDFMYMHIPLLNTDYLPENCFDHILNSMGGIPRILDVFRTNIGLDVELDHLTDHFVNTMATIDEQYHVSSQWIKASGSKENLLKMISWVINSTPIDLSTIVDEKTTIEDIMKYGIIFIKGDPKDPDNNYLSYPLIILEILNRFLHFANINIIEHATAITTTSFTGNSSNNNKNTRTNKFKWR
ncbi:hypothetical protein DFA_07677 [Cavenderia fasciculata]|uniref:Uncharacterized protein n=1 Tax=Cavenderia fasciculata TaxID=261658 RepID=F4Q2S3_CACFS|nr:uncharacterized protein DFA_07677 [Cavenderia fasciculata]EGG16699.1 hypothetical protein DFA_07677 [Cavenderia fasciculata]|eukprot:XP_004355173.1 hypothetical protein DFA_07677 [Cavenderia fasciculata]